MDVTYNFQDVDSFFEDGERDLVEELKDVGREAVDYAKANGDYQNRTGLLRSSNKYEADKDGLVIYNDAPYASNVEQRGYDVISGAALMAEKRLKEGFEQ